MDCSEKNVELCHKIFIGVGTEKSKGLVRLGSLSVGSIGSQV